MAKFDEDIEKEIENLEKLIEEVKQQQDLEKKKTKQNKAPDKNVIRIDLGSKYSTNIWINFIASFLINFLLMYFINIVFQFFTINSAYTLLIFAASYTIFEETYKYILMKKYLNLVLYSYGLIFYLFNIIFIYLVDLYIFPSAFSFVNEIYPLFFVIALQFVRIFVKNIYVRLVHIISLRLAKIKNRK
ncbi:MAG: hypothetical protein AB7U79_02545 [Candidatus Izemoplasmatales bacterium]